MDKTDSVKGARQRLCEAFLNTEERGPSGTRGDKELWSKIPVTYTPEREGWQKQYEEIMPPNPPNLMETRNEQITEAYDVTSRINAKKSTWHIESNCCKAVKRENLRSSQRGKCMTN